MTRLGLHRTLTLAAGIALVAVPLLSARADDDFDRHHDNGRHRGWYKHHYDDGPRVYYAPAPVYVVPPPAVVYAPPVYAAPVYVPPPSLNVIIPLRFK